MERDAGSSPARGSYGICIFFIVFCSPSAEGDVLEFESIIFPAACEGRSETILFLDFILIHAACEGRVFFVELFEFV